MARVMGAEASADRHADHGLGARMARALFAPVDAASLVAFRVILGLLVSASAARFIVNGWVERSFVEPTFFFKYWGCDWVAVWPRWGLYLHFALLVVLGLCVAAGFFYRVSAWLMFVGFTYVELMDVTNYLNHYYLVSLLALLAACMPLGSVWSIDSWRRGRVDASPTLPGWCLWLLRFQIGVVYLYAGIAKMNPDWLFHGQPLNIWLSSRSDMPLFGWLFVHHETALAMSWAGMLFDTTVVLWLSWRRSRPYAYAVVVVFHLLTGALFNIGMFPLIMTLSALLFFSPSWPRRAWAWLHRREAEPLAVGNDGPERRGSWPSRWRWGLAAALAFAMVQLVVPWRHLIYAGDVLWDEQGMRWSWRVMVREKNGAVTYRVVLPDGRTQLESPERFLADYQAREMSAQPDLILQLAHHIAEVYRREGHGDVAVYADVRVSLNGRRGQLLVDPDVDLTRVDDSPWQRAHWVTPPPETPPPHLLASR